MQKIQGESRTELYQSSTRSSESSTQNSIKALHEAPYRPIWSSKALLTCSTNILGSLIIVFTNDSALFLRTALHCLYERLCIVSTNDLASSLRRLYYCPYSRLYNHPYDRLCIVSTNGSALSLRTYERLCIVSTNGPASCLRRPCIVSATALHRLYDGSTIARAVARTIVFTTAL